MLIKVCFYSPDLVPKDNAEKWLRYLEAECPTFLFKASMQIQDRTVVCICGSTMQRKIINVGWVFNRGGNL